MMPSRFFEPLVILALSLFNTGSASPLSVDSSKLASPLMSSPSSAATSPALISITSPTTTLSTVTNSITPSFITATSVGMIDEILSSVSTACFLDNVSKNLPTSTNVTIIVTESKYASPIWESEA